MTSYVLANGAKSLLLILFLAEGSDSNGLYLRADFGWTVSHNRSNTPYPHCRGLMDTLTCKTTHTSTVLKEKQFVAFLTSRDSSLTINLSSISTKTGSAFWQSHQKETMPVLHSFSFCRVKLRSSHARGNLPRTRAGGSCHRSPHNRQSVSAQTPLSAVFLGKCPDYTQMIRDDLLCSLCVSAVLKNNREHMEK